MAKLPTEYPQSFPRTRKNEPESLERNDKQQHCKRPFPTSRAGVNDKAKHNQQDVKYAKDGADVGEALFEMF